MLSRFRLRTFNKPASQTETGTRVSVPGQWPEQGQGAMPCFAAFASFYPAWFWPSGLSSHAYDATRLRNASSQLLPLSVFQRYLGLAQKKYNIQLIAAFLSLVVRQCDVCAAIHSSHEAKMLSCRSLRCLSINAMCTSSDASSPCALTRLLISFRVGVIDATT